MDTCMVDQRIQCASCDRWTTCYAVEMLPKKDNDVRRQVHLRACVVANNDNICKQSYGFELFSRTHLTLELSRL